MKGCDDGIVQKRRDTMAAHAAPLNGMSCQCRASIAQGPEQSSREFVLRSLLLSNVLIASQEYGRPLDDRTNVPENSYI
jgi:hypothetical protein